MRPREEKTKEQRTRYLLHRPNSQELQIDDTRERQKNSPAYSSPALLLQYPPFQPHHLLNLLIRLHRPRKRTNPLLFLLQTLAATQAFPQILPKPQVLPEILLPQLPTPHALLPLLHIPRRRRSSTRLNTRNPHRRPILRQHQIRITRHLGPALKPALKPAQNALPALWHAAEAHAAEPHGEREDRRQHGEGDGGADDARDGGGRVPAAGVRQEDNGGVVEVGEGVAEEGRRVARHAPVENDAGHGARHHVLEVEPGYVGLGGPAGEEREGLERGAGGGVVGGVGAVVKVEAYPEVGLVGGEVGAVADAEELEDHGAAVGRQAVEVGVEELELREREEGDKGLVLGEEEGELRGLPG